MTVTTATLDQLCLSPHNVRTNEEDANDTAALEASLLEHGQMQPLIVHPMRGSKKLGVFAGGRRYRAFRSLIATRGDLPIDHPIDIVVREGLTDADLTEQSLAENMLRRDLRAYEQHAAIARAIKRGAPEDQLARHFGQTVRTIRQWARLAEIAPPLLAAYQDGKLLLDQISAYASTADHALQVEVFKQLRDKPAWQHEPPAIRRAMKIGDAEEARLLRFVGEEAFRDAGGRFELDLFAEEADHRGRVETPDILRKLVEAKYEAIRDRVRKLSPRPVRFQAGPPQRSDRGPAWHLEYPMKRKPLDDFDAERLRAIETSIEDVQARIGDNYDAAGQPIDPALNTALQIEIDQLVDDAAALEDTRQYRVPDGDIVATIDIEDSGGHQVKWWWASEKARAGTPKSATTAAPTPARPRGPIAEGAALDRYNYQGQQDAKAAAKEEHGVTADGLQIMRSVRREIMRAFLITNARAGDMVGRDAFIWAQLRMQIAHESGRRIGFQRLVGDTESVVFHAQDHVAATPAHTIWQDALRELSQANFITEPDLPTALSDYLKADAATKNLAGAVIAGLAIERSADAEGYHVPVHDMIVKRIPFTDPASVRKLWEPTAEMLALLPRAQRLAIVEPLVDQASFRNWSNLKAGELIPLVLRVVRGTSTAIKSGAATAAREWIHPLLRFADVEVTRTPLTAARPPEPSDQRDILEILAEAAE